MPPWQSAKDVERVARSSAPIDQHVAVPVEADRAPALADAALQNPLQAVLAVDYANLSAKVRERGIGVLAFLEASPSGPGRSPGRASGLIPAPAPGFAAVAALYFGEAWRVNFGRAADEVERDERVM